MSETRIDPEDGQAYTFEELLSFYKGKYKKKAVQEYWDECKPMKKREKKKSQGQEKAPAKEPEKEKKAKAKAKPSAKKKEAKSSAGSGKWRILYHGGDFKGRAEFMRLIFEDAGVAYEESADKLYGPDGFCDAFRSMGSSEKGLADEGPDPLKVIAADAAPFPVMFPPVLHFEPGEGEAEVFINQVPAIMRYCAARLGYQPKGALQFAQADQIMLNANDMLAEGRRSFHPVNDKKSYSDQKEEADKESKAWAANRLPVWLAHFEKVAKSLCPDGDRPLLGKMTYADFVLFHVVDAAEAQFNTAFYDMAWDKAPVPTLKKWKAYVAARPNIAAYLASGRRKAWAGDSMV